MMPAPQSEVRLKEALAGIGVGLRHRGDLRSWELYSLNGRGTLAVHGSYRDIITKAQRLLEEN